MFDPKIYNKEYYKNNKEKLKEYSARYSSTEKAKIKRKIRENNPEFRAKTKKWDLKKNYGIGIEEYNVMLVFQNNSCAICFISNEDHLKIYNKNLCVDHCHKTGKIRGLLCGKCNRAIGNFNDNISLLENGIEYLRKNL